MSKAACLVYRNRTNLFSLEIPGGPVSYNYLLGCTEVLPRCICKANKCGRRWQVIARYPNFFYLSTAQLNQPPPEASPPRVPAARNQQLSISVLAREQTQLYVWDG